MPTVHLIRILFAEDSPTDMEIAYRELSRAGLNFIHLRVDTPVEFEAALVEFKPDLVISDYSMPQFNGMEALKLARAHTPTLPFIILTGSLTEEIAVDCMKAGASDYIIKDRIARLPFAVREALEKKEALLAREAAELALRDSLLEKELLLRELFHRTRNNMQVIQAMLEIEADYLDNPLIWNFVRNAQNRIRAMSLVHDKLYQSQDLSKIPLHEYVIDLARLLQNTFRKPTGSVTLNFQVEPILALLDIALPCGLILNELVSNAFEHGFPGDRSGEITIALRRAGPGELLLEVVDNGVGLPPGFDWQHTDSIGLTTATTIARHQLQGALTLEPGNGLTCRLTFRDDLYKNRV